MYQSCDWSLITFSLVTCSWNRKFLVCFSISLIRTLSFPIQPSNEVQSITSFVIASLVLNISVHVCDVNFFKIVSDDCEMFFPYTGENWTCCNQMNNSFIISFAERTRWVYTVIVELVFVYLKDIWSSHHSCLYNSFSRSNLGSSCKFPTFELFPISRFLILRYFKLDFYCAANPKVAWIQLLSKGAKLVV